MNEQEEDDVGRFLILETFEGRPLPLNSYLFHSGLSSTEEEELSSSAEQEKRTKGVVESTKDNRIFCSNNSSLLKEEKTFGDRFFNQDFSLLDESLISKRYQADISGEAGTQLFSSRVVSEIGSFCDFGGLETDAEGKLLGKYGGFPPVVTEASCLERPANHRSDLEDMLKLENIMCSSNTAFDEETMNVGSDCVFPGFQLGETTQESMLSFCDPFQSRKFSENCFGSRVSERNDVECFSANHHCFGSEERHAAKLKKVDDTPDSQLPCSADDFEMWRLEINSFLKRRGLSRREFAKLAKIGKNTVGKYLSGRCKRISKEVVHKIIYAYCDLEGKAYQEQGGPHSTKVRAGRRLPRRQKENMFYSRSPDSSQIQTDWDRINKTSYVELEEMDLEYRPFQYFSFSNDGENSDAITASNISSAYSSCHSSTCEQSVGKKFQSSCIVWERSGAVSTLEQTTETTLPSLFSNAEELEHVDTNGIAEEEIVTSSCSKLYPSSCNIGRDKRENLKQVAADPFQCELESSGVREQDIIDLVEQSYYMYSEPFRDRSSAVLFVPLQIDVRIPEERSFSTLYPWRLWDNRQTIDSVASKIAARYNVPIKYEDTLKNCIQLALSRWKLLPDVESSRISRKVSLDLDLGEGRYYTEEFHVDYPWPENFPYVFARQICMDLNLNPRNIERIAISILKQLNEAS